MVTTTLLVIADAELLHHPRPLRADEIVTIVALPTSPLAGPLNTITASWREFGELAVTTRTVDGNRQLSYSCDGADLFDDLRLGAALRRAIAALDPTDTGVRHAPLFCATTDGAGLHAHSRIRLYAPDACFIRTTTSPLAITDAADLSWLTAAIGLHATNAGFLNNHELHYTDCFSGRELEYKYNLPAQTSLWALAADTHRRIAEAFPGMTNRYRDDLRVWDFVNYLFEVTGPTEYVGYVSFMRAGNGGYQLKRKTFTADAFIRGETVTPEVVPDRPTPTSARCWACKRARCHRFAGSSTTSASSPRPAATRAAYSSIAATCSTPRTSPSPNARSSTPAVARSCRPTRTRFSLSWTRSPTWSSRCSPITASLPSAASTRS